MIRAIQYNMILQLGNTNCGLNQFCAWIAHELCESQMNHALITSCTPILQFFDSRLQHLAVQGLSCHTWPSWLEWSFLWPKITENGSQRMQNTSHCSSIPSVLLTAALAASGSEKRDVAIHNPNPKQQTTLFFFFT